MKKETRRKGEREVGEMKKKSNKELMSQLREMTTELRVMTERINEMNRTIAEIRQNLRGEA